MKNSAKTWGADSTWSARFTYNAPLSAGCGEPADKG